MDELSQELQKIKDRNRRVEADKAWETSLTRRGFIAGLTYIVALIYMQVALGVDGAWLQAAIPAGGYLFSTFSLPILRKYWGKAARPQNR
jgi:hypothetical protein